MPEEKATGAQTYCEDLVQKFKGTPFIVIDAMSAIGLDAVKTLKILQELQVLGCCRCPVNDGGINLFQMSPAEVRRYNAQ